MSCWTVVKLRETRLIRARALEPSDSLLPSRQSPGQRLQRATARQEAIQASCNSEQSRLIMPLISIIRRISPSVSA